MSFAWRILIGFFFVWLPDLAYGLKVSPESVACLGWRHDRPQNDFAVVDLLPYEKDPLMLMGEIDDVHYTADLFYLPQEGVGLFVSEPAQGLRASAIVGWYRLGDTDQYEANLTIDSPDLRRRGLRFGVRCFTPRP